MIKYILLVLFCFVLLSNSLAQQTYKDPQVWISALQSNDPNVVLKATFAFKYDKGDSIAVSEGLINGLRSNNEFVLINIVYTLGDYQIMPERTIPALITVLEKGPTLAVMAYTAVALGKFGEPAVQPLLNLIKAEPAPFTEGSNCYTKYSYPAAFASMALTNLKKAALSKLKPDSSGEYTSGYLNFVAWNIQSNFTDEQAADYYHVMEKFDKLLNVEAESGPLLNYRKAAELVESCLNDCEFLKERTWAFLNDPLHRNLSNRLISEMLDEKPEAIPVSIFIEKLDLDVLTGDAIFERITNHLAKTTSEDTIYNFNRKFSFEENIDTVSIAGLNNLAILINQPDRGISAASIYLTAHLVPRTDSAFNRQTPIVNALFKASQNNDGDLQGVAFKSLMYYVKSDEVKNYLSAGFLSNNPAVILACCENSEKLSFDENNVYVRVTQIISQPLPGEHPRTSASERGALIQAVLKEAGLLSQSKKKALFAHVLKIIDEIHVGSKKDPFLNYDILKSCFSFLATVNNEGPRMLESFATANIGLDNKAILEILSGYYDGSTAWNNIILHLLHDKDLGPSYDFEESLGKIKYTKASLPLLGPLLALSEGINESEYRNPIFAGLMSIGDTVIRPLIQLLRKNSNDNTVLALITGSDCKKHPEVDSIRTEFLQKGTPDQKAIVLSSLMSCGHKNQFLPYIDNLLADTNKIVPYKTAIFIQSMGRERLRFLPKLISKLKDTSKRNFYGTRRECLLAILNMKLIDSGAVFSIDRHKYNIEANDLILNGTKLPIIRIEKDTAFVNELIDLTNDTDPTLRELSVRFLSLVDTVTPKIKSALINKLADPYPNISLSAVQSIYILKIDAGNYQNLIRFDREKEYISTTFLEAFSGIKGYFGKGCTGAAYQPQILPSLPWPPPPASTRDVIPVTLLSDSKNLGDVYNKIVSSLIKCQYQEFKLFAVDQGFAIITHLERIDKDGAPSGRERWTTQKLTPINISEYIRSLLVGTEGDFRAILFVVTPLSYFRDNGFPILSTENGNDLYRKGGNILPKETAAIPFKDKYVHVLIYQFYKKNGESADIIYDQSDVVPTLVQLRATQFLKYLSY